MMITTVLMMRLARIGLLSMVMAIIGQLEVNLNLGSISDKDSCRMLIRISLTVPEWHEMASSSRQRK